MIHPLKAVRNAGMRTKLILICIAIIVPVFAASVFLLLSVRDIIRDFSISEITTDTDNVSTRFSDVLSVAENVAAGLSENAAAARFIVGGEGDNPLKGYAGTLTQIRDIEIFLEDGLTLSDSGERIPAGNNVTESEWYNTALTSDKPFWGVIPDEEENAYYLTLFCPVAGDVKGFISITVNPGSFSAAASSIGYPVILTFGNGVVIYSGSPAYGQLDIMDVPVGNAAYPVIQDNFFYGSEYTVTMPFITGRTLTEFRIYITLPVSALTEESRNITLLYVWYVGLCLILSILISILLTGFFAKRLSFLKNQMLKVTYGDFLLTDEIKGDDEINALYGLLKQMVKSIMKSNTETSKARLQAETFRLNQVEAEFKALASQINPHFLYNTLETIRMKAFANDDRETAELLKVLGKFMRRSLAVKDGLVSLESELEFTHNYLKLQSARFGDRVTYNIYSEPDNEYQILPLIIEPLVENAYAHGVESVKQGGYILIAVKYAGMNVLIDVMDNGAGMDKETLQMLRDKIETGDTSSGRSIGLTNVHMRIRKYFGEIYGMNIFSEPGKGTLIRLTLPRHTEQTER
jgi:two-component system sensor histidine kinase YesM